MTERATLSDYAELLAFENEVFGVRFQTKVPKLYAVPETSVTYHGVIKENGSIIGGIAAYPTALETDCGTLTAVGIGSVAVDPAARGKGCMVDMLQFCNRCAAEMDADLAFLSGYRHRYEHNGYVPCGLRYRFEVTDYYLSHFRGAAAYTFTPLDKDAAALDAVMALFAAQTYRWRRPAEDFVTIAATWAAQALTIRAADGTFCGYLIAEKDPAFLSEFLLVNAGEAAPVLVAYARQMGCNFLKVSAEVGQRQMIAALAAFTEQIETVMPAAFKIYHWRRLITVLGNWKARHFAVTDGSVVVRIADETLRITIQNQTCTAAPTDDAPDLVFTAGEAAVALTTGFGRFQPNATFAAWAPLCPLGIPHADEV